MSGRDHETDHDGECFPNCRECRIYNLGLKVERLQAERDDLIGILARAYETINKQHEEIKNLEIDLACEKDGEGY